MAETPATQRQFDIWKMEGHGPEHQYNFPGCPDHPAEMISWHQATSFCDWLSETIRTTQHGPQRATGFKWKAGLPSEAQWEYACGAGAGTEYHTGDGEASIRDAGWCRFEEVVWGATQKVGQKKCNGHHLHDLHGNVWEWCADTYDSKAYRKRNGVWHALPWNEQNAGADAEHHWSGLDLDGIPGVSLRGGSYVNSPKACRTSARYWENPCAKEGYIGFRPCLTRVGTNGDSAGAGAWTRP